MINNNVWLSVKDLEINDTFEHWENGIPYSVRVLSKPYEACSNNVWRINFKAACKGGNKTLDYPFSTRVKMIEDNHEEHFHNEGIAPYPKGTIVRGVSID